jgi:hypothetical protein
MLTTLNNWTFVHILLGARATCNSECTYHDTAHGNNQARDSKKQLHVDFPSSFSAEEERYITDVVLPNLYPIMRPYNFLFNWYIRQQAEEVASLINQHTGPSVH